MDIATKLVYSLTATTKNLREKCKKDKIKCSYSAESIKSHCNPANRTNYKIHFKLK